MALTVTATASGAGSANGTVLAVRVLNNASLTQNGGTAQSATVTTPQIAVTPHATGSMVYGAAVTGASGTAFSSLNANSTSLYGSQLVSGEYFGVFKSSALTASTSPATYGWGAPTEPSGDYYAAVAEILAAGGTLAEDASTPAVASAAGAKSATTASFTPPAGAVLVAVVLANWTFSGAVSIAVADSASAYTWTQLTGTGTTDLASVWAGIPNSVPLPAAAQVTAAPHPLSPPVPLPRAPVTASALPLVPALVQGYPAAPLGAVVELQLNETWTDFTAAALPDGSGGYGQVKSGQPDGAQQPNPASQNGVWDNPGYALSPRNSASPYYPYIRQGTPARVSFASPWGTYLRLEGATGSYAWCPEAGRLDITGSLDVQLEARLSDGRLASLAFKDDGAGSFCWQLALEPDGTLRLFWFDAGAVLRAVSSDVAFAVSIRAFRVTLDASTGTVTFYTAASIAGPWTQAGSAISGTGGAATTVKTGSGTAPLTVGTHPGATTQGYGQLTAFRLYNGISGAGGTLVADAAFSSQAAGATAWNDSLGNRWGLAGDAEISGRDYRLYGELSTANPTAHTSGGKPRLTAALSGRLRRLQQAAAAPVDSPLYRAIITQAPPLYPVVYYPMEDGSASQGFGPAVGTGLMTVTSGAVKPAADTTFAASAALPLLNGAVLTATVPAYSGASGWAVRFPVKLGGTVPAGAEVARVNVSGGACAVVQVLAASPSGLELKGLNGGGGTVFDTGVFGWTGINSGLWLSIEASPSGGSTVFTLTSVAPGASSGSVISSTVSGTYGTVTSVVFNTGGLLTDTVVGHLSAQKAVTTIFEFGAPLNAYTGEFAADRFARICAQEGIACRILGAPWSTQVMGAQPRGSAWTVLKDCAQTEQGIIYEPRDVFGVGFRTKAALGVQAAALTLDFSAANLPGDLQPQDDDQGFYNDVTASMPDGTAYRAVLDDGSASSVSEPPAGRGRYASQPPFTFNLASSSQLAAATALYLAVHSVNEARYRNVTADFGIPGLDAAAAARLRPGDLIILTNVPGIYQSGDISQLAWGATETFGPGRAISWDCVPASPYT